MTSPLLPTIGNIIAAGGRPPQREEQKKKNMEKRKKSILTDSIYDRWFGFRLPHSLCLGWFCLLSLTTQEAQKMCVYAKDS